MPLFKLALQVGLSAPGVTAWLYGYRLTHSTIVYSGVDTYRASKRKCRAHLGTGTSDQLNGINGEWTGSDDVEEMDIYLMSLTPYEKFLLTKRSIMTELTALELSLGYAPDAPPCPKDHVFRLMDNIRRRFSRNHYDLTGKYSLTEDMNEVFFCVYGYRLAVSNYRAAHTYDALNGAQGEVTGSDDFDAQARIRAKKESKTNRHRTTPGASSGRTKKAPVDLAPVEEEKAESESTIVEEPVFLWGDSALSFDGESFSRTPGSQFGEFDASKKRVYAGVHPFRRLVHLPRFSAFGMDFESCGVVVIQPVQNILDSSFPFMTQLPRNYANILRFLKTKIPLLNPAEQDAQAKFYAYQVSLFPGVAPKGEFLVPSFVDDATYDFGSMWKIAPSECDILEEYEFNTRWRLTERKGFQFRYVGSEVRTYPRFTTQSELPRLDIDALCQLNGSKPFVYYDVSSNNVQKALSRYFKARENEEMLYINQLSLVPALGGAEVLSICDATLTVEEEGFELTDVEMDVKRPGVRDREIVTSRFGKVYSLHRRDLTPYSLMRTLLCNRAESVEFWVWLWDLVCTGLYYIGSLIFVPMTLLIYQLYSPMYQYSDRFEFIRDTIELPTPKRILYRNWFEDEYQWPRINGEFFKWSSKLKKEPAKVGKAGRLYASGEAACLLDRVSPDIGKKLFKQRIDVGEFFPRLLDFNVGFSFIEASEPEVSRTMFEDLLRPRSNGVEVVCFSDDGFGVLYWEGTTTFFEVDISSCDASNGPPVFGMVYEILKILNPKQAKAFLRQATYPTKVVNPAEQSESVLLTPEFFFEYSGHSLTTFLNNCAFLLNVMGFAEMMQENSALFVPALLNEYIQRGAELNGYKLTSFVSEKYEDVTFLKRFYNGTHSVKALGCILRSLGIFLEGLNPSSLGMTTTEFRQSTEMERLKRSVRMRAEGEVNEPHHLVLNAMRTFAGLPPKPEDVPLSSLIDRYGGEPHQWYVLVDRIETLRPGHIIHDPILSLIYKKDYGLE